MIVGAFLLGGDVAEFGFLGWRIGRLWGRGEGWGVEEKGKTKKKVRLYLVVVVAVEKNRNFFRKKLLTYNGGVVSWPTLERNEANESRGTGKRGSVRKKSDFGC